MEEAFRVTRVDHLSADIPTCVVNVSGVCANVNLLRRGLNDRSVSHTSSNFFQVLFEVVGLRVTDCANRIGPFWLLGAQQVLIDRVLDVLYDVVDALADLVAGLALVVLLIGRVVQLAVSN